MSVRLSSRTNDRRVALARQLLLVGYQVAMPLFLICFALAPEIFVNNAGLSYFGVTRSTIGLYAIAMVEIVAVQLVVVRLLRRETAFPLYRWWLLAVSLFLLGVLFTPYTFDPIVGKLHSDFGTGLFVTQLGFSSWMVATKHHARLYPLFVVQTLAGAATFLWMHQVLPFGVGGQALFQIAFGLFSINFLEPHRRDDLVPGPAESTSLEKEFF